MSKFSKSHENRHSVKSAYTVIEMLAVMFIIGLAIVAFAAVRSKHSFGLAVAASVVALFVGVLLIFLFYRWSCGRDGRRLAELREQFRTVYRVKELPTKAKSIVKPEGSEIQVGDYGWDARPTCGDGLIHLQGLTKQWQVVWHAGFRPEQIEKVAAKPASQYDYWIPYWATTPPPPPCPFPIRERNTPTMGLPHHSGHYFREHPSQFYESPQATGSKNVPGMTAAQSAARNKASIRQSLIWTLLFIALAFVTSRVCFYMDRAKPALWIQILTGCGIFSVFVINFVLGLRMAKRK